MNTETRVNRLINIVTQVSQLRYNHISLRLRGSFAPFASKKISRLIPNEKLTQFIGDTYKDWNMNTLEQVLTSDSPYYCLMQEDYSFMCPPAQIDHYLNLCIKHDVDYSMLFDLNFINVQIKSFPLGNHYGSDSEFLKTYDYSLGNWDTQAKNYHGSMIGWPGFFKKRILVKILKSPRPYLKKYPPYSPFNFEKGVNQTWLLPIRSAHPAFELMGCIDDDIRVPNSSLINRGLYQDNVKRIDEQFIEIRPLGRSIYKKLSMLARFSLNTNSIAGKLKSPRLKAIYANSNKTLYKNLALIDSLMFSLIYYCNRFVNSSERRLRRNTKLN